MFGIGYAGDELQKNCVPQEKYANKLDIEKLVWYNSNPWCHIVPTDCCRKGGYLFRKTFIIFRLVNVGF